MLTTGRSISNIKGKCIILGKVYHFYTTKIAFEAWLHQDINVSYICLFLFSLLLASSIALMQVLHALSYSSQGVKGNIWNDAALIFEILSGQSLSLFSFPRMLPAFLSLSLNQKRQSLAAKFPHEQLSC